MSQYCTDCKHRFTQWGDAFCRASGVPYTDHVRGLRKVRGPYLCEFHRQGALCNDFEQKPPSVLQRIKAKVIG